MYQEFYSFSEEPFALNPDPKFLYLSLSHWKALSAMISGIKERKSIMVITGEVGVGKTLLIYKILRDLDKKFKAAYIFNPGLDFDNLLRNILQDLKIPIGEKDINSLSLMLLLKKYLQERLTRNEMLTMVIDEAQNLDEPVLADLLDLSNLGPPGANLVQLLLVGHPALEIKLNSGKLHLFKEKIGLHRQIKPFNQEEGRGYINHRLALAGRNISEVFTSEAANLIWEVAGGNPRVMNQLCNRALLIGFSKLCPTIDFQIVRKAIKDFEYVRPRKPKRFLAHHPKKFSYKILRILFFLFAVSAFLFPFSIILKRLFQR
jgi:general secretion pathway protein A